MTRAIEYRNYEGDPLALADAASVVLCDPTGTYGIKDNSDDSVIVAAETATTKDSTGLYSYDISALDTTKTYTAYWKVTRTSGDIEYVPWTIAIVTDVPPTVTGKSYVTVSEGETYFTERLNSDAWDDASEANKAKAVITATRLIDRLNFIGSKTSSSQTLQFPRNDDTDIPDDIKYATLEIALALLDGVDPELEYENLNMVVHGYSNAKSTYDRSSKPEHVLSGIPSVRAWTYLKPYLRDPFGLDLSRVS